MQFSIIWRQTCVNYLLFLSYLVHLCSCLLFFLSQDEFLKELIILCRSFLWQIDQRKKKYRLVRWNSLCQPKVQGGLAIQNLDVQNKCILSKWIFKLCNENGMWEEVLRKKSFKTKILSSVDKRAGISQFLNSLFGSKSIPKSR